VDGLSHPNRCEHRGRWNGVGGDLIRGRVRTARVLPVHELEELVWREGVEITFIEEMYTTGV
jgi:hypothetical protein